MAMLPDEIVKRSTFAHSTTLSMTANRTRIVSNRNVGIGEDGIGKEGCPINN